MPKKAQKEGIFVEWSSEVIRSRQNRAVVELCKLTDRKAREATKSFRFDGVKLFCEAVKNGVELQTVFIKESRQNAVQTLAAEKGLFQAFEGEGRVVILSDDLFDKISEEKSPEGIICCAKYIDKLQKNITISNSADFLSMKNEQIVLLESVRDPSNIGAIIRSAAAIGVDRLIVSADCADIYHPKAVRASMGTLFNQPIDRVADLAAAIKGLRFSDRRVFAAALDGRAQTLGRFPIQAGDCVVIGNEGHGLTEETVAACDACVMIPMTDRAESFNAAVAASLLMWEFAQKIGR
ncbi:MAG: RNA methyltransferase [Clostridia bacterium]|nr:RNA methyltransferase [Clostridia bacterium]